LIDRPSTENDEDGYAFRDLVVLRAIVSLLDRGIPLQRIRRNLDTLRGRLPDLAAPVAALRIWDEKSDRLVVSHAGRLEEAGGQLLLELEWEPESRDEPVATLAEYESGTERSAATSNEDAVGWFERGCELDVESETWPEAIEAYEKALELDPEYADAYCNLGAVRYNQGKRAEARRAFEACLARAADHVEANFNLANVLEEAGNDAAALAHYRRALAADPLYPDLHINLALLYEKIGRPRPAREHWRRYLQLDSNGSWAEVARTRLDRESDQA
jgi:tetratricopeptide (TPR) repeat protein